MDTHLSAYVYSYPHKLAYRMLEPAVPLGPLWQAEDRQRLFLYAHVPFCEMRCGFCNLFTSVEHQRDPMQVYVEAFERQHAQMLDLMGPHQVAALATGGGTPTQLPVDLLERLLACLTDWERAPGAGWSCETSPDTATPERLRLLRQAGVTRVSMGVQSFQPDETKAVHRTQQRDTVERALAAIRDCGFAVLNLDLMVGLPGQTPASLVDSIKAALDWEPEELYVYPLYVRPATRLYREHSHDPAEVDLYRVARDYLLSAGYVAVSRRMYRRAEVATPPLSWRCQRDGMVGLGCGARSYTNSLHYSSPYALGSTAVGRILREYTETQDFTVARYGFVLDEDERRRRTAVLSLLSDEGFDLVDYQSQFGAAAQETFPFLEQLEQDALVTSSQGRLWLTAAGLEQADQIGPLFFSETVRQSL